MHFKTLSAGSDAQLVFLTFPDSLDSVWSVFWSCGRADVEPLEAFWEAQQVLSELWLRSLRAEKFKGRTNRVL